MIASVMLLFVTLFIGTRAVTCDFSDDQIVQVFQEYVRINTTTGSDFTPAVEFWRQLAADENVSFNAYELSPGYPVLVLRWPGQDPSLRSVMLNSHMDVVPANDNDGWTYPAFSAELANGEIWGRGTQDMKSVSIQYYAALRRLRANNVTMLRDVYMTLMPDEETGSSQGMSPFLRSEQFAAMRVGIELDEGAAFDVPSVFVFYQDKASWDIQVDCYGTAMHGSTFTAANKTATGQCLNVMNIMFAFREREYAKYLEMGRDSTQAYTSINLNRMYAGTANNVVPRHVVLVFDIRLSTTLDEVEFERQLNQWIREAGDNVTLTFLGKDQQSPATMISSDNPYWVAMQDAAREANITIVPVVPSGSTDARFVRKAGYPAFGFSPMPNTKTLLHAVDERIGVKTFLDGIRVYEKVIEGLANIPGEKVSDNPSDYLIATTTEGGKGNASAKLRVC